MDEEECSKNIKFESNLLIPNVKEIVDYQIINEELMNYVAGHFEGIKLSR